MDQSKEELLGAIQRLNTRAKQQSADLKGQRESLKEIDDELPAKKILNDLQAKATAEMERLKDQRGQSEEWRIQNAATLEAKASLEITLESLSENLVLYMVKTKSKAVHAYASEPASVDREITVVAKIGAKVPANLSLFDQEIEGNASPAE